MQLEGARHTSFQKVKLDGVCLVEISFTLLIADFLSNMAIRQSKFMIELKANKYDSTNVLNF